MKKIVLMISLLITSHFAFAGSSQFLDSINSTTISTMAVDTSTTTVADALLQSLKLKAESEYKSNDDCAFSYNKDFNSARAVLSRFTGSNGESAQQLQALMEQNLVDTVLSASRHKTSTKYDSTTGGNEDCTPAAFVTVIKKDGQVMNAEFYLNGNGAIK